MHGHLAGAAAAAHADILDRAAEPGQFMPLEMAQGNENVRIHDRTSDKRGFENFTAVHGHFHIVRTLQAVADDDLAPRGQHGIAVFIGRSHMFQRILAPPYIQGIAVGQKGLAAQRLHAVRHGFGEIGPQERKVPRFAKMQLDRHKLVFKINLLDACGQHQLVQFLQQAGAHFATHVGKIHF